MPRPLGPWERAPMLQNQCLCVLGSGGQCRRQVLAIVSPTPKPALVPGGEPSLPTLSSSWPSKQGLASLTCFAFLSGNRLLKKKVSSGQNLVTLDYVHLWPRQKPSCGYQKATERLGVAGREGSRRRKVGAGWDVGGIEKFWITGSYSWSPCGHRVGWGEGGE